MRYGIPGAHTNPLLWRIPPRILLLWCKLQNLKNCRWKGWDQEEEEKKKSMEDWLNISVTVSDFRVL